MAYGQNALSCDPLSSPARILHLCFSCNFGALTIFIHVSQIYHCQTTLCNESSDFFQVKVKK